MPDEKVKYTFEHLVAMEKEAFFIQVDNTVFTLQGEYFFDQRSAKDLSDGLMKGFRDIIKKGNKKQRKQAYDTLLRFNIFPLRFH
jgi:hypothetical protein